MGMKPTWRPATLAVARELTVHAPVGLLDVLEHDVHLVGGGLADLHHGVGDGGHDLALLLIGAAGVPLDGDVGHGGLSSLGRMLFGSPRVVEPPQVVGKARAERVGLDDAVGAEAHREILADLGGGVALAVEPAPRGVAVVDADLDRLAEHSDEAPPVGLALHDPALLRGREVPAELDRDAAGHEDEREQTDEPSRPAHGADYCTGAFERATGRGRRGPPRAGSRARMTAVETFTAEERAALAPYFTELDGPVFALVNLPEVVKGALFARYSRSAKSLRRLFLDEFLEPIGRPAEAGSIGTARADRLYERVFSEYGDDSVAQLGGVHLACESASNILTKVLEWGRLMAYLEQSTRYVPYTDRPGGRFKYHVPAELDGLAVRDRYVEVLDRAFETYSRWIDPMREYWMRRFPQPAGESDAAYRMTIRAKALDSLRGLLPAATRSNVGIFGTGQGYEALLLRMRAHPLQEVREHAALLLTELRKVIPAFLTRVDRPDRGTLWSRYLAETRAETAAVAARLLAGVEMEPRREVTLTDFDPDGEVKIVAAALYASSSLPDDQLLLLARKLGPEERRRVLESYVGARENRRHKPGRAFERTAYRFDVLGDYGAFRDLQRHRLLTLEWQPLSTRHGWVASEEIETVGALPDWRRVMDGAAELYEALVAARLPDVAPYAVAMAYRVRFYMELNAREAMHMIELRTTPPGHPAYRRICQAMHRLIAEQAGHPAIAAAMSFADLSDTEEGRLASERATERKRRTS